MCLIVFAWRVVPGVPLIALVLGYVSRRFRSVQKRIQENQSLGKPVTEGEVSVKLEPRPAGVMSGYAGDPEKSRKALGGSHYGTGDVASRDLSKKMLDRILSSKRTSEGADVLLRHFQVDRVLATRLGMAAIDSVVEGYWGTMVALKGTDIEQVGFEAALGRLKTVPQNRYDEAAVLFG